MTALALNLKSVCSPPERREDLRESSKLSGSDHGCERTGSETNIAKERRPSLQPWQTEMEKNFSLFLFQQFLFAHLLKKQRPPHCVPLVVFENTTCETLLCLLSENTLQEKARFLFSRCTSNSRDLQAHGCVCSGFCLVEPTFSETTCRGLCRIGATIKAVSVEVNSTCSFVIWADKSERFL